MDIQSIIAQHDRLMTQYEHAEVDRETAERPYDGQPRLQSEVDHAEAWLAECVEAVDSIRKTLRSIGTMDALRAVGDLYYRPLLAHSRLAQQYYLPSSRCLSVSDVAVTPRSGHSDGNAVAVLPALSVHDLAVEAAQAECGPLPSHRVGFHEPHCSQHIGLPVQRTVSDHLSAMDDVRENATLASLKGHYERSYAGISAAWTTGRHVRPFGPLTEAQAADVGQPGGFLMRWVAPKLVGNEALYAAPGADVDDDTPDMERLSILGDSGSYDDLAATVFEGMAVVNEQLRLDNSGERTLSLVAAKKALYKRLKEVQLAAASSHALIQGGRQRAAFVDGAFRPTEVGSNELPADATLVDGVWQAKTAMRTERLNPQRVDGQREEEFDTGSGIAKVHSHRHMPLDMTLDAKERTAAGDRAWHELQVLMGLTPLPVTYAVEDDAPAWEAGLAERRLLPMFMATEQYEAWCRAQEQADAHDVRMASDYLERLQHVVYMKEGSAGFMFQVHRLIDPRLSGDTVEDGTWLMCREDSAPYTEERGCDEGAWADVEAEVVW